MSAPRVLVVEHEKGTGPGQFGERLAAQGLDLDLCRPWDGDRVPREPGRYDGLLVLGGSMGPYDVDRAPWLPAVCRLLRAAAARDLPTLGICLGMELLTVACGGKVRHAEHPEVGLCELTPLLPASRDELFAFLTESDTPPCAVQWHWEETSVPPEGAVPLLTSARCTHQAYRIGTSVWGVQFHPEVLAGDIATWGTSDTGPLQALGLDPDAVVGHVAREEQRLRTLWGGLAERWGTVVSARRRRRDGAE
ncbi:type 1 glutamine amidotransferase [Streptomyces naganishii]|uniref:Aminotransferase n=1 Tax=Streptomyces naganishii JCM 4654 TaxID=1306179 RepID=A0A919CU75_9ACTN|nr:type 1 glutamine amidotransferase [Streptomyces naganishii]GHD87111.1 aminotransferase [Streptomyces naganishii JCM 4654]